MSYVLFASSLVAHALIVISFLCKLELSIKRNNKINKVKVKESAANAMIEEIALGWVVMMTLLRNYFH